MNTKIRKCNFSRKTAPCPKCRVSSKRHSNGKRRLREVGISTPVILEVIYSKHYCKSCQKYFSLPLDHLAPKNSQYTNRVRRTAMDLILKQSMTLEKATTRMRQKYHVYLPPTTVHDWIVANMID